MTDISRTCSDNPDNILHLPECSLCTGSHLGRHSQEICHIHGNMSLYFETSIAICFVSLTLIFYCSISKSRNLFQWIFLLVLMLVSESILTIIFLIHQKQVLYHLLVSLQSSICITYCKMEKLIKAKMKICKWPMEWFIMARQVYPTLHFNIIENLINNFPMFAVLSPSQTSHKLRWGRDDQLHTSG